MAHPVEPSLDQLRDGLLAGDRGILARAITLAESTRPEHQARAAALLTAVMPRTGAALRVGITGVPGAGKSTFIDALGTMLTGRGRRVAVLAIDPSSSRTGGSILGDKTRMRRLSVDPRAFIRPSPTAGTLGGVAARTRETIRLCEAAGYDLILVETVGVGQSETVVAGMCDFFLVLLVAGAGDELQGIKRGIVELADLIAVNKADGDNATRAAASARDYAAAVRLLHPHGSAPPVRTVSALTEAGVPELWGLVRDRVRQEQDSGAFEARRATQRKQWMWELIHDRLGAALLADPAVVALLPALEVEVIEGRLAPTTAAMQVLAAFLPD